MRVSIHVSTRAGMRERRAADPAARKDGSATDGVAPLDAEPSAQRSDLIRQDERIMGRMLRGGVLLSAGIIVVGVILYFVRAFATPHAVTDPPNPRSLTEVISGMTHGDPVSVVSLGLLLLLATPVINVLVSIVNYALQRDRRYVIITSLVLLILLISFALGKGGA